MESYAIGLTTDRDELERQLTEISEKQTVLRATLTKLHQNSPQERRWQESAPGQLEARFLSLWPGDVWLARDPLKAQLLQDPGVTVTLRFHFQPKAASWKAPKVPAGQGRRPYRRSELCELEIVCARLGVKEEAPLKIWETAEEWQDYRTTLKKKVIQEPPAPADEALPDEALPLL